MNLKSTVLFLAIMIIVLPGVMAKEINVKGKITAFKKIPLSKVSIVVKSSGEEVVSDENGIFSLTCDEKEKLTVIANGFFPEKIKVADFSGKDSLNVDLRYKKGKKNFEIATGYGHISEKQLSYAIEHLESGPDYSAYQNILEAIEGRVSGVSIGTTGINIRGNTTLNQGPVDALLVVDGTIVDFNVFTNIPPAQVKSISVLKGAAASSRYGSRGMGGVVIIKTKSQN